MIISCSLTFVEKIGNGFSRVIFVTAPKGNGLETLSPSSFLRGPYLPEMGSKLFSLLISWNRLVRKECQKFSCISLRATTVPDLLQEH